MKYLTLIRIFILWFICLSVAYSVPNPTPEITILTGALGKDGEKFPAELSKLWQPILVNVDSNSVEIAPNIKLIRIDLPEEKEFVIPSSNSLLDNFIKPDPRVSLKKAYNYLEQSKINGDFSNSQPINETQLQANKEIHNKEISLSFEIVSTKSSPLASNQFSSITELLPALKKQIEKDSVAGVASLKYAIFYKLPEAKGNDPAVIAQESIAPRPNIKGSASAAESTASCIITPTTTTKRPNWYAVIEIGSTGVKPIAMGFKRTKQGELISAGIQEVETFNVQNVDPIVEISIPRVVKAICDDINQFHQSYGDLPIFLVGSSSMAKVAHRPKLEEAIFKSINLPIDFITAKQEVEYLASGIWASLPSYRQCESAIIDIGGNIKGGYLENCNSKGNNSIKNQLVTFEIEKYGPKPFSQKAQQKIDQKIFSTFPDASGDTRKDLESILYDEVSTHPEFTNGKKRVYLVGGAVWAADTLLCLNCPQYGKRSQTDDQDEYTVMKPSDIEEFYRYASKEGDKVCDHSQENPYLRRDMDGGYTQPWDKNRIEKQQAEIDAVCRVFTSPQHLISAAEILRAIQNKMEINENRHIFFMQNNLYTWSKQYLIDKIQ